MSTRDSIQYHKFHFVATRVLESSSVDPFPPLCPARDELRISTWRSHADAYSVYLNYFLSVLSRSTFDKSLKEGITAEHDLL